MVPPSPLIGGLPKTRSFSGNDSANAYMNEINYESNSKYCLDEVYPAV